MGGSWNENKQPTHKPFPLPAAIYYIFNSQGARNAWKTRTIFVLDLKPLISQQLINWCKLGFIPIDESDVR